MSNLEMLPNEVLIKICSFLNLFDIRKFAQVSKRWNNFCKDEIVIHKSVEKINFYNKKVPLVFLENVLDYGCKYLSLSAAALMVNETNSDGTIKLKNPSKLKYLDVSACRGNTENVLESFLESCINLEKFALRDSLKDSNGCKMNWKVMARMISQLCFQNGQTLQVMDLSGYHKVPEKHCNGIRDVVKSCVNLREFTPFALLSESAANELVSGLTQKIKKLNLSYRETIDDRHIEILVQRCKNITHLNLRATFINKISVEYISENLPELEKLDISENQLEAEDFMPLCKLSKLKVLVAEEDQNLGKMIPQDTKIINFPQYTFRSMGIADTNKTYDVMDGFWEIKEKQFPPFDLVYKGKLFSKVQLSKE